MFESLSNHFESRRVNFYYVSNLFNAKGSKGSLFLDEMQEGFVFFLTKEKAVAVFF